MGRMICTGTLLLGGMMIAASLATAEPARVLILSGQNNHAWQETTPRLKAILDASGSFSADVLETPASMTAAQLSPYAVIVSNWNAWGDVPVKEWPPAARDALLAFVREGKGFVSVHAGTSSFYDWPEYQELAITAWDLETTGHGKQHHFTVSPSVVDHPITQGMAPFTTFDELWHGVPVPEGVQVLAMAWSSPEFGGTGKDEPILFTRGFGAGRSVNLLLGHHVRAMSHPGFAELLIRSVEWAATGEVAPRPNVLAWHEDEGTLALTRNDEVLWQFNFGASARKPFFHPIRLAGGPVLSWEAPPDHPWHHGLWFSWKFINGLNYWEENAETGESEGKTFWDSPRISCTPDGAAVIEIALRYGPDPGTILLEEQRTVRVSAPDWLGAYHLDWTSIFTARAPEVLLDRTPIAGEPEGKSWGGYAGLSMRFAPLSGAEVHADSGPVSMSEPQANLDATALDFSGSLEGVPAGIAVALYPENAVRPTPWYIIARDDNQFYYYSPALLYRSPRKLMESEQIALRYRIVVHPGAWGATQLRAVLESLNDHRSP
jgi:type 1 glutamine amidotransferase